MVGEIRDKETADIAIQASLTGHLVLSTVHTNSAVNAITRLRDMGIEPYLLSSSLLFVLSQRLVRRLCVKCKKPDNDQKSKKLMESNNIKGEIFKPVGCKHCDDTGYSGRLSIGECIVVDEKINELIYKQASEAEITDYVFKNNKKIFLNGLEAVTAGETSITEILRVSQE
jgi:general secretion pathway protein E